MFTFFPVRRKWSTSKAGGALGPQHWCPGWNMMNTTNNWDLGETIVWHGMKHDETISYIYIYVYNWDYLGAGEFLGEGTSFPIRILKVFFFSNPIIWVSHMNNISLYPLRPTWRVIPASGFSDPLWIVLMRYIILIPRPINAPNGGWKKSCTTKRMVETL